MNLENLSIKVIEFTKSLGEELLTQRESLQAKNIEHKGTHDLVTILDKYSEKQLVNFLGELIPESGFIAEEGTSTKIGKEFNWIVDPIDGTTNFIHGIPCFAISIALQQNHKTIFGLVYEMNLKEAFYAYEGGQAYLNEKKISVSKTKDLDNSLIATGFPYSDYGKTDPYLEVFKDVMKSSRGLRRLGSAATDLAYVAAGRFEAFYEYGLSPWDVAAGGYILQKAGGIVSEFSGKPDYIFGKSLIASNKFVYKELQDKINKYF